LTDRQAGKKATKPDGDKISVTFLVSAIVSPMWGSLADRKGRKLMLLRASLGMKVTLKVSPDHIDSASCEVTPSWET
jgi:MFS-type transporter involved in bile tolerance (Atg22 family)